MIRDETLVNTNNDENAESTTTLNDSDLSSLPKGGLTPFLKTPNMPLIFYRGDDRPPSEIFKKGFRSHGGNETLITSTFYEDSAHIYTSTQIEEAIEYPQSLRPGTSQSYIYEINSSKSINVREEFISQVAKGKVSPEDLKALEEVGIKSVETVFKTDRIFIKKIEPQAIKGTWTVGIKERPMSPEVLRWIENFPEDHEKIYTRTMQETYIPNPNYIPPAGLLEHKLLWKVGKGLGYGLTGVGLTLDGLSLHHEYQLSKESGDYNNTYREGARIVGGWTGALTVGTLIGQTGAAYCTPIFPPYSSAACGILGGLGGSIFGYFYGGEIATQIFDVNRSNNPIVIKPSDSPIKPTVATTKPLIPAVGIPKQTVPTIMEIKTQTNVLSPKSPESAMEPQTRAIPLTKPIVTSSTESSKSLEPVAEESNLFREQKQTALYLSLQNLSLSNSLSPTSQDTAPNLEVKPLLFSQKIANDVAKETHAEKPLVTLPPNNYATQNEQPMRIGDLEVTGGVELKGSIGAEKVSGIAPALKHEANKAANDFKDLGKKIEHTANEAAHDVTRGLKKLEKKAKKLGKKAKKAKFW